MRKKRKNSPIENVCRDLRDGHGSHDLPLLIEGQLPQIDNIQILESPLLNLFVIVSHQNLNQLHNLALNALDLRVKLNQTVKNIALDRAVALLPNQYPHLAEDLIQVEIGLVVSDHVRELSNQPEGDSGEGVLVHVFSEGCKGLDNGVGLEGLCGGYELQEGVDGVVADVLSSQGEHSCDLVDLPAPVWGVDFDDGADPLGDLGDHLVLAFDHVVEELLDND